MKTYRFKYDNGFIEVRSFSCLMATFLATRIAGLTSDKLKLFTITK